MSAATASQTAAILANGNVLVEAAAGAGKTRTLVDRCMDRVLASQNPVSVDNILMVTFTEAAAAEMRRRIRKSLEEALDAEPENARLQEQLALLDTARIGTLHSFCLQLVRGHFYELELDPQLGVIDEAQSQLLAAGTLDELLKAHYANLAPGATAVQQLILAYGRGRDDAIRALVLRLHEYAQTLADADAWIDDQINLWRQPHPGLWHAWLADGLTDWRDNWLSLVESRAGDHANLTACAAWLGALLPQLPALQQGELLGNIASLNDTSHWPRGTAGKFRKPLEKLFEEAAFLRDILDAKNGSDPLLEDWGWARSHMLALLELTKEFGSAYARTKRELAALDFHDLEQFSLRLLWDRGTRLPSAIAEEWRNRLSLVFVDEYQDINEAQDRIIQALSRSSGEANRFLVGDVKQSIYRFRLANPRIFLDYAHRWHGEQGGGRVISLADNFRSHEGIIQGINAVFSRLMRPEIGGLSYDEAAHLRFGAPGERTAWSLAADPSPRLEMLLRISDVSGNDTEAGAEDDRSEGSELSAAEREARMIGQRVLEMVTGTQPFEIWDDATNQKRRIEWRDVVVLLRSPRRKAENFAKEFARLGVPLTAPRAGFFDATEVTDLVCLLQLLDNPLQDIPLLAVLRSPLAGLTLDELAVVRISRPKGRFWWSVLHFEQEHHVVSELPGQSAAVAATAGSARAKLREFLRFFHDWRRLAQRGSLSQCLETVLDETHYEDWLSAQPRGAQRRANVQKLLHLARQFDRWQGQGLFRFLRLMEAGRESGIDPEPSDGEAINAVRLMSIHQSKGLEFPVVIVADLGKRFNLDDLRGDIILDEKYGLCPRIKPPMTEARYPSLPWWLAARRQRAELLGEEIRLLYVAFTRARDYLILAGSTSQSTIEKKWGNENYETLSPARLLAAGNYLDWLGPITSSILGDNTWWLQPAGKRGLLRWQFHITDPVTQTPAPEQLAIDTSDPGSADALAALCARLEWNYEFGPATLEPAKTSVSAIRRRIEEETDDEARPLFAFNQPSALIRPSKSAAQKKGLGAAETGIAHHKFLQHISLEHIAQGHTPAEEAARLTGEKVISPEEADALNLAALEAFWRSRLGRRILADLQNVRRELPFTARFTFPELSALNPALVSSRLPDDEFVVVQGVADLVILRAKEIIVVDFKTDEVRPKDFPARVAAYTPQLQLYGLALAKIYRRPVTECWLHFLTAAKSVEISTLSPK